MLKIHLVPTAEGADPVDLEIDNTRLSNREAKQVERYTGVRAMVFQAGLAAVREIGEDGTIKGAPVTLASEYSDADHLTVIVWLALRRNGQPDLKLDDVPEFDSIETSLEVVPDPTDGPVPGVPADPPVPAADVQPPVEPSPAGAVTG